MGCSQAVRHQTLTLAFVGSNPASPANFFFTNQYGPLAQMAEHVTFNHGVRSSTLRWLTTSEQSTLCSVFLCQEKHPPAPLLLLFPKNPKIFWESRRSPRDFVFFRRLIHVGTDIALFRFFYAKKNIRPLPCSSFSQKIQRFFGSPGVVRGILYFLDG